MFQEDSLRVLTEGEVERHLDARYEENAMKRGKDDQEGHRRRHAKEKFSFHSDPSKTPRISSTDSKSVKNGHKSVNSVSWGSLNQVETGTALLGWKMYDAGELSMMMQECISLPSCML